MDWDWLLLDKGGLLERDALVVAGDCCCCCWLLLPVSVDEMVGEPCAPIADRRTEARLPHSSVRSSDSESAVVVLVVLVVLVAVVVSVEAEVVLVVDDDGPGGCCTNNRIIEYICQSIQRSGKE